MVSDCTNPVAQESEERCKTEMGPHGAVSRARQLPCDGAMKAGRAVKMGGTQP